MCRVTIRPMCTASGGIPDYPPYILLVLSAPRLLGGAYFSFRPRNLFFGFNAFPWVWFDCRFIEFASTSQDQKFLAKLPRQTQ